MIKNYYNNFAELLGKFKINSDDTHSLIRFTGKFVTPIAVEYIKNIDIQIEDDYVYLKFDDTFKSVGPFRDKAFNNINIVVRQSNNRGFVAEINLEILNVIGMMLKTKIKQ